MIQRCVTIERVLRKWVGDGDDDELRSGSRQREEVR